MGCIPRLGGGDKLSYFWEEGGKQDNILFWFGGQENICFWLEGRGQYLISDRPPGHLCRTGSEEQEGGRDFLAKFPGVG